MCVCVGFSVSPQAVNKTCANFSGTINAHPVVKKTADGGDLLGIKKHGWVLCVQHKGIFKS